jgi:hypothetical protein
LIAVLNCHGSSGGSISGVLIHAVIISECNNVC